MQIKRKKIITIVTEKVNQLIDFFQSGYRLKISTSKVYCTGWNKKTCAIAKVQLCSCPQRHQMMTDFQNSITARFNGKSATK